MAAALFAVAQTADATTLWEVWQSAKAHAPALQQAEATLEQAHATHSAALAQLLPALNFNASRVVDNQSSSGPEFYGSSIVTVSQAANTRTNGWALQMSQPLFDWHAIQNLSAADYSEAAGIANAEAARQALMATLTQDYLGVLNAQAQLTATREAQDGFATQAMQAEARYKAGLSGIIGTDETQAALAQAQAETLAAAQALKQARRHLDTDAGVHIRGPFPDLPVNLTLSLPAGLTRSDYMKHALQQNPTLAAARLNQTSAGHALSATSAGYLPSVSLVLTHQRNFVTGSTDFSAPGSAVTSPATQDASQNLIGLQLSWAIFSGGATSAAAQTAEAQQRSADADARTAELTVASQVSNALDGLTSDQQRVQQLQTGVTSAQAAVNATAQAVSKGLRTEQDLVIARQTLLTLKTAYAQAVVDLVNNRVALEQALGALTPRLLSQLSGKIGRASANSDTGNSQPNGDSLQ
ncbi:MAG: TolC family protein [Gammaproteobacteria bacterium]|nr:TolC family protein [Gammaproteobacteria bacterium]MDE2346088.1 TolC family protein [Gammaproteobacteria bacterium]